MDEADFFAFLEYRVCDEIPRLNHRELSGLWCDGLCPAHTELSNGRCAIYGEA